MWHRQQNPDPGTLARVVLFDSPLHHYDFYDSVSTITFLFATITMLLYQPESWTPDPRADFRAMRQRQSVSHEGLLLLSGPDFRAMRLQQSVLNLGLM